MLPTLVTCTTHFIEAGTLLELYYSSTCATCNRTPLDFNKLEVVDWTQHYQCSSSFILHTLSWCQIVVRSSRNWEHLTVIKQHSISRGISRLKYSEFFQDHLPQHIGDVKKRVYFHGLEKQT